MSRTASELIDRVIYEAMKVTFVGKSLTKDPSFKQALNRATSHVQKALASLNLKREVDGIDAFSDPSSRWHIIMDVEFVNPIVDDKLASKMQSRTNARNVIVQDEFTLRVIVNASSFDNPARDYRRSRGIAGWE